MKTDEPVGSSWRLWKTRMGIQIRYTIKEFARSCRYGMVQNRHFIILREKKLVYLVNAKVANTSIKQTFTKDILGDGYDIHKYPFEQASILSKEFEDFYSFTFVRNPFIRLVSCYISKYEGDLDKKMSRMAFEYYLLGILKKDRGFEHFAKRVAHIPDCFSDRHFRSQYCLTHDFKGRKLVKDIGHLENIGEEFLVIQERFDLGKLPQYNQSKDYSWMDYYTPEIARLVYKRYRRDFENFGYQDEYRKLMQHFE